MWPKHVVQGCKHSARVEPGISHIRVNSLNNNIDNNDNCDIITVILIE